MRDLVTALGEGDVNLNVANNSQSQYDANPSTVATKKKVINEIRRPEDADDSLTQQIDQLKEQFLQEDSQIEDNIHAQEHSHRWSEEAQRTNWDVPAQIQHFQKPSRNEKSTKETTYSQLFPPAGPLVSETQLHVLFEDTQFNKGFTKPSIPNTSKETQDVHGPIEESQDTQYIDDLKQKLLEEETQVLVGDCQPELQVERVEEQQATRVHKEEREDTDGESIKEHVPEKERILSQADDTQLIEGIKAQALDSIVNSQDDDTSQLEEVSALDRIVFTETSSESQRAEGVGTQGSDQVVLFPTGTSLNGGGGIEYTQSQFAYQNAHRRSFVAATHSSEQSSGSQVAAQRDADNLSDQPTSHPQNTTTFASSQPKITERVATASNNKHNKRKASTENINRLKTRAMDDWSRDSMGTGSQTQVNDSGPRYGTAARPESRSQNEGESFTKKSRSSATHIQSSGKDAHSGVRREEDMGIDRTYNENESGAVRLDFTQSQVQAEENQNLQVSQDRGLRSPSYEFARQNGASQLEPETPATGSKNPFAKSRSAVPMGMSQVFAATQSSPLDPRFLQSDGIMPSSPGVAGLASSPAVRRAQTLPGEASSPSHVELTVASSFQPFDESTQPEPVRKARLGKWKAETESQQRIEAQYAHLFVGRTEPGDLRFTETEENGRRSAEPAMQKQKRVTYESDDGMDIEEENRKRIAAKRLKDKMEKNLREVGDMATGPRNTSPPLDRVRRAASTGRVIVKNDIRGARLRERQRQSLERTTSAQDEVKKAEQVEVPASGEATIAPTARTTSREKRTQSEKYRARSEGVGARDTQSTDSQVIRSSQIICSTQPRRGSQPEVVVDSQANINTQAISTQPDSTHRSPEEVEGSYNPPESAARANSINIGRFDSRILPNLGRNNTAPSTQAKSSPPGTSIPVTSSSHYLKKSNPNSTPGGSKASNDIAPEVVPETSPLWKTQSKTASPEKPFGDLSQVIDSPMKSFEDFPMTQEPPNQIDPSDITPSKFVKSTNKVYGKKSPVKKRPDQKLVSGLRVIFTEEPSEPSDIEQAYLEVETPTKSVKKPEKTKRASRKTAATKKVGAAVKSADMVVDDEDAMDVVTPKKVKKSGKKASQLPKPEPTLKSATRVVDSDKDAEEVLTPAKDKTAKPKAAQKSARFAIDDGDVEQAVNPKKGRKAKTKIASPPVPEQSQLFCTQVPPAEDVVSPERTRNRATKKTEPYPLGTAFDDDDGYDAGGMDDDGNPYSPQHLPPKVFPTIADFEAAKKVRKAGGFILDEDSQGSDPLPTIPMAKRVSEVKDKQVVRPLGMPVARMSFSPHAEENEDPNVGALATLQQLNTDGGRGKGNNIIPHSRPVKALPPAEDKSPDSSPIRPPHRRSTRRQPSDLQKQISAPTAPTSDHQPFQPAEQSDEDDVPIALPVTKRRQDAQIRDSSDNEMAGTSPAKTVGKPTSFGKSTTVLSLHSSDEAQDESVSPVRPSIEGVEKKCHWFINGHTCTKDHSKDALIHDETLRAISQKRCASFDIPSTASPGKESSPRTSSDRDSRSASAFTRPNSVDALHLPPTATGGRVRGTSAAPQQQVSEYATTLPSTARNSVESSPLSEIASDVAEELEEFLTAQATAATSRQESTDRSRSGIEMSDALLIPLPQTVTRRLDFAAPVREREYVPPVFRPGKGKGKRGAEGSAGGKVKKARKTTPEDTASRPRKGDRASAAANPAAADDNDDEEDEIIVVEETPRATPRTTPARRQGRKASRPSYAESKFDTRSH